MTTYTPPAEAVEAAARAIDPSAWRLRDSGTFPLDHPASMRVVIDSQKKATAALTAAGPIIAAETGERIAREIEDFEPEDRALAHMPDWREAMYDAARIARGEGQ